MDEEAYLLPQPAIKCLERAVGYIRAYFFDEIGIPLYQYCSKGMIKSPIEQLFYIAFETLKVIDSDLHVKCLEIGPQVQVLCYRVDFMVKYFSENEEKTICVELDGHKFHERDEKQRRYEKKRDRDLQKLGYQVMHFTGKEVTDNPFKVAAEVISAAVGYEVDNHTQFIDIEE